MALEILWTAEADRQLDDIITFLELNWKDKDITKFYKLLEKSLSSIVLNPRTYKVSHRNGGVREFLITKHNTIFILLMIAIFISFPFGLTNNKH